MSKGEDDRQERLDRAREWFRRHHANVEPDAGFAARVSARLEPRPVDMLGWAALRLLPATVALVLILAWFSFSMTPRAETTIADGGNDDLLTWLLEEPEATR